MGSNYVQEREAICRNPPDTLGRKRLAGSRCHSQVVTKAMYGVKGHSWYWEVGYARNIDIINNHKPLAISSKSKPSQNSTCFRFHVRSI